MPLPRLGPKRHCSANLEPRGIHHIHELAPARSKDNAARMWCLTWTCTAGVTAAGQRLSKQQPQSNEGQWQHLCKTHCDDIPARSLSNTKTKPKLLIIQRQGILCANSRTSPTSGRRFAVSRRPGRRKGLQGTDARKRTPRAHSAARPDLNACGTGAS